MLNDPGRLFDRGAPGRAFWNPDAQTASEETLAGLRTDGIAGEWARVWEHPIPFYRDRYAAAGFGPGEVPGLDDVPVTTKADLRADEAANPPLGAHRAIGLDEAVRVGRSTGTTGGRPVYVLMGRRDLQTAIELQARAVWACGVRPGDRFAHSWPFGLYVSSGTSAFWYAKTGVLELPLGPPDSPETAAEHVRIWDEFRPRGLMVTGTQLDTYVRAAERIGLDLAEILAGTTVVLFDLVYQFEAPRKRVEERFGIRVRNMSGASDIPGFGCADCDHHTGVHVPGDHAVVQVCDPRTGRSLPPGERGHLVVTTFGMDAFFLRYDLEDVAVLEDGPCPCGQTGQRFRVLGRSADQVRVDGRAVLPVDVQLALDAHGAPEFRLLGAGGPETSRLVVRLECEGRHERFAEILSADLGVPVDVDPVPSGTFPRSSFKPRRVDVSPQGAG
ncbi:phenylacetate--CoA ligase family protein [Actinomadura darangshiensis]|uniref:Phenylacetate--CoA ligase family protein n=1 Tax=Actinomadura darangshiensis TaxID=705336 RepID=A0A4R5B029_9ACTN|nr:phenylacetate--CoA ligase family protein [Actinomadura darangshiensis]TDD79258.1 phenylacetate--CoA ligase family protein [Actinomadura darangshiensis]